MATSRRSFLALAAFTLAFVFNPGYFGGCTSEVEGPNFGEAEMLALLDEANATGPFDLELEGVQYRLELLLTQKAGEDADESASRQPRAAFAGRAYACGNRTFMASAAACVTLSTVPLLAEFRLVRLGADGETTVVEGELPGQLIVDGNRLTHGRVEIYDTPTVTIIQLDSRDGASFELAEFRTVIHGLPTTF